MKKRPGGAAVLLRERFPKIVPQWRCEVAMDSGGSGLKLLKTVRICGVFWTSCYGFFRNGKGHLCEAFQRFWILLGVLNVDDFDMKSLLVHHCLHDVSVNCCGWSAVTLISELGMGAFIVVKPGPSQNEIPNQPFFFSRSFSHLFQGIGAKQRGGGNVRHICIF